MTRGSENSMDLWALQIDIEPLQKLATLLKESVPEPWECPIDDALEISKWYYTYHGAGGWLHIVLDDGNLGDSSVDYCKQAAENNYDIVCYMLACLIRTMTEDNRVILYNRLHGHPDDYDDE